ncbi:MAG TPA: peptidyl-prolyl cis-trans isomerase [Candidatus Bathyarchaeia archaeon]|nr:peptidyl-prolyl cis-trans isomerase [Candidatus Bathyarchaeia archaeon]
MSHLTRRYGAIVIGGILLFSFQGCDQIQKFIDYLSPNRKPATEKILEKAVQEATPLQSVEKTEALPAEKVKAGEPQNQAAALPKDVLVRVGEWTMTQQEFKDVLQAVQAQAPDMDPGNIEHRRYVLGNIIQQQLFVQEGRGQKIHQRPEIQKAIKEFEDSLVVQVLAEQLTKDVSVSDQEVESFYTQNKDQLVSPAQWRVQEIVVGTEEKAKELVVQLNQGASFEETAKAQSIGKTAGQGGDLGVVETFAFEKMGQVVSALDVGEISGAFKGPEGFYVVKLVEKKGGDVPSLVEIQEELKEYVLGLKQQETAYTALEKIQEKIKVDVNEQLLEDQAK